MTQQFKAGDRVRVRDISENRNNLRRLVIGQTYLVVGRSKPDKWNVGTGIYLEGQPSTAWWWDYRFELVEVNPLEELKAAVNKARELGLEVEVKVIETVTTEKETVL